MEYMQPPFGLFAAPWVMLTVWPAIVIVALRAALVVLAPAE
jgi:hypothetical protein